MVFTLDEEARIVRAVGNAERESRGEVRLCVERRCPVKDPLVRAKALYRIHGLDRTEGDTGVLLYVATRSRVAAVYGGGGVHDEDAPWTGVTDAVAKGAAAGAMVDGLCEALGVIGEHLRARVPGDDTAGDELPNAPIVVDGVPPRDAGESEE